MGLIRTPSKPAPLPEPAYKPFFDSPNADRLYHWIEDGLPEDFLRNILESDLAPAYAFMGTCTTPLWRALQGVPDPVDVPLHGTYVVDLQNGYLVNERILVEGDFAGMEVRIIDQFMLRPEVNPVA